MTPESGKGGGYSAGEWLGRSSQRQPGPENQTPGNQELCFQDHRTTPTMLVAGGELGNQVPVHPHQGRKSPQLKNKHLQRGKCLGLRTAQTPDSSHYANGESHTKTSD